MFLAYDPEKKAIRSWGHMEFEQPCFILTISPIGEPELSRAAVLSDPFDLYRYLATVDAVVVHSIQLLSPGELNGTGTWCLDELLELTHLSDPKSTAKGMLYKTVAWIDSDVDLASTAEWIPCVLFSKIPQPMPLFGSNAWSPFGSAPETFHDMLARSSSSL
ncbi:hypothetical protein YA0850_34585 [Pseudomonas veronii]|uniref:Uncharacterized protein n=1 Tax=Pseudomonas veronii TaxID=76761 RepID=A0ABS0VR90_PSEVE|nr:hypothetical protein [Pseudomonas veronii]MBI6557457.1 hypothetical protein [Pseudomonas veronii]MBI6654061.1 hypothetical protein [Pseudomonas veronii]